MTSERGKPRRRYGSKFKAMVLAQSEEPGMSAAQVAMPHGMNDNVVHRSRQQQSARQATPDAQALLQRPVAFVPVAPPAPVIGSRSPWDVKKLAFANDRLWPGAETHVSARKLTFVVKPHRVSAAKVSFGATETTSTAGQVDLAVAVLPFRTSRLCSGKCRSVARLGSLSQVT